MKIAVVTRYFPSSGEPSQGRSLYNTLRVLARSADVRVFYPNAAYPSFFRPRSRMYSRLDPSYRVGDIDVNYHDYQALPLVSRPLNGWLAARTLLPHVRAFSPDLVFGCFLYPESFAALKIAHAIGKPTVAMAIGSDINRISDSFSAMHTRSVLREADMVVTVSSDLARKAVAMGAAPAITRAVLNGCDLSVFHPRDMQEARKKLEIDPTLEVVLYLGRMDLKKGLRELVDAAAALHVHRPNLQFYLVGAGPDRSIVEEAATSHNSRSFVHVISSCPFDHVAIWIAAANLVVLPSYMEGCPNVILEALACGRPVVASRVGGIPEIMNEACGSLVPPRDARLLGQAIADVLDRSWDPKEISAQGGRAWTATAAELMEIFESLISCREAASRA